MKIWFGIMLLITAAALSAAPMTREEQQQLLTLYQKTMQDLQSGRFDCAICDIDDIYTLPPMLSADPTMFATNRILTESAGKYFTGTDDAAKAAKLAMTLRSVPAKLELYHAWARAAAHQADLQPAPKELTQKIAVAKNAATELENKLSSGTITKWDYNRQQKELTNQIAEWQTQLQKIQTTGVTNRAIATDQVMSILLADPTLPDNIRYRIKIIIGTEYQRILDNSLDTADPREHQQSARRILELFADDHTPATDPMYYFINEMKLDALLANNSPYMALKTADALLETSRCEAGPGRAAILLKKGYLHLQLKQYSQANRIAAELQGMNIKAEPLQSKIIAYFKACTIMVK